MVSRRETNAKKRISGNGATAPAVGTPAPMKVTVNEVALRTLHERMLRSRRTLSPASGGRKNSGTRNMALLAAAIDLHAGDAVADAEESPLIPADLASGEALHLLPPHLGLAAGVALAYKLQGDHRVVLALASASALNLGSAHEALIDATSRKLPLIVVVDGEKTDNGALDSKAAAYGIPSISVDANDAVAIYRVSREAIDRARAGRGPTLIHCLAFDSGVDPVARLERYLQKHGW